MDGLTSIGSPPWSREDIKASLPTFESLYHTRPIQDNSGGMKSPHMFATWFMAKFLSPPVIVESGIFKGQSTWLLEQACPDAEIISIDLNLSQREYVSERVSYFDRDFADIDWSGIDTNSALAFFDDHQNAYSRLQLCRWFGFRHVIFEDNYPANHGDCYSLKQAFSGAGFEPLSSSRHTENGVQKIARKMKLLPTLTPQYNRLQISPNQHDAAALRQNLEVYSEFPPLFQRDETRWGDSWTGHKYATPDPLLPATAKEDHPVLWDEAIAYTWICYTKLKC
jgi:hypothetical protein